MCRGGFPSFAPLVTPDTNSEVIGEPTRGYPLHVLSVRTHRRALPLYDRCKLSTLLPSNFHFVERVQLFRESNVWVISLRLDNSLFSGTRIDDPVYCLRLSLRNVLKYRDLYLRVTGILSVLWGKRSIY